MEKQDNQALETARNLLEIYCIFLSLCCGHYNPFSFYLSIPLLKKFKIIFRFMLLV